MDVGDAIVIFGIIQGVALAFLAIFEFMQVYAIRKWLVNLIPQGAKPGDIMADGALALMERINTDPKAATIVGGFVRGAALAAWDEVKGHIPGLGGPVETSEALEKLAKKNPWFGLGLGIVQTLGPMVAQQMQPSAPGTPQARKPGSGGRVYG